MTYKSPAALEMAVKEAAKASPRDTGRAISGFYFHRLLCRVFAGGNSSFVLKGGQSVLARTLDARTTRDIDLLSMRTSLDDALSDLRLLVQRDLGDFISYEFAGAEPIKTEDEYRSGLSVQFVPMVGSKRMQTISIDLVVDEVSLEGAELIEPVDRLDIKELESCSYLVYPVEAALADKLCALAERHNGRPSSRVKDLVDVVVYALSCDVDGGALQLRIARESGARRLARIEAFALPEEWGVSQARQYAKLCAQTGLPESLHRIEEASALAEKLFGPVLAGAAEGSFWSHATGAWEKIGADRESIAASM